MNKRDARREILPKTKECVCKVCGYEFMSIRRTAQYCSKTSDDNRIENLELWNTSQPAGQRIEDKLTWARQLLDQYSEAYDAIGVGW